MSVAVIFSFLSSMRAGHSSSICSYVSVLLPHALLARAHVRAKLMGGTGVGSLACHFRTSSLGSLVAYI